MEEEKRASFYECLEGPTPLPLPVISSEWWGCHCAFSRGELGWFCSKEKASKEDLTMQTDSSALYLFMCLLVSSCLQLLAI